MPASTTPAPTVSSVPIEPSSSMLLRMHHSSLRRALGSTSNNKNIIKRQQSDQHLLKSFQKSQQQQRRYLTVLPPSPSSLNLKPSLSSPTIPAVADDTKSSLSTAIKQSPERQYSSSSDEEGDILPSSSSLSDAAETSSIDDQLSMPATPPSQSGMPSLWPSSTKSNPARCDDDRRPPSPVEHRDRYGFKQPTQWVRLEDQLDFERQYQPILERQAEKWDGYLEEHQGQWPPMSSKLKRYVRKGIPHHLRGKAWMHYSGAKAKMEANQGLYQSLVRTAEAMGEHNEYAEIIDRDLHRTFPDNVHFQCGVTAATSEESIMLMLDANPKLQALRRVLLAFSVYAPNIGYCQSLNYLAGFFLLFLQEQDNSEEAAFWMLITTVHDYFPENMYDMTMEGAHIDQTVLMMMVYERLPAVWNKLGNGKCFWECVESEGLPSITLVTSHWFLTLFINILPVETVLRVWDCLYIEGSKVLFRAALTIISMNEKRIRGLDDPIEVFPVLQNMPRRLIDCHAFMDTVFSKNGVGADLSTAEIEKRRVLFRERRKQQRAAAAAQVKAAQAARTVATESVMPSPASATASLTSLKNFYFGRW